MSLVIKSGASSDLWTIDSASKAGRVTLYDTEGNPIQLNNKTELSPTQKAMLGMGSDGKLGRFINIDKYGRQNINQPILSWFDPVLTTAVNTVIWTQSLTTQTMTQANSSILFNASALTTASTGSMINSVKQFFKKPRVPLLVRFTNVQFNHFNNSVIELGFGLPISAIAATPVVNGAFLRVGTDGTVSLVVSSNGTEKVVSSSSSPNKTDYYTVEVLVLDDSASLMIFDSSGVPVVELSNDYDVLTQAIWTVSHLPIYARIYNNATTVSAPSLRISTTAVYELDSSDTESLQNKMVSLGKGLWNNPFTTFAQLANYTNNAAPTLRTPSNTVAGETTLGGIISWSNGANSFGASDTLDLILFGYQNISPLQMVITDLAVDTINLGAVNGATDYAIQYFIAINGTAISLATASYSRQSLGFVNLPSGSPIGRNFNSPIRENFQTPIVVEAGRFFVLGARVLSGTATAGQIIRTSLAPKGYFK